MKKMGPVVAMYNLYEKTIAYPGSIQHPEPSELCLKKGSGKSIICHRIWKAVDLKYSIKIIIIWDSNDFQESK